jgi:hypothetical protein
MGRTHTTLRRGVAIVRAMARALLFAALFVALPLPACSRDDAAPPALAASAPEAAAPPSASVRAPDLAFAVGTTSAATEPATATATATVAASAGPASTCGDKLLPPCPLYAWMKKNTSPAMRAHDFDALATALEKVATFAPKQPGYVHWASISRDGAAAARVQNLDAVKAACRGCHDQYKDKYKKEMRDRPI